MPIKVLISGATGYIGGSILSQLLKENTAGVYSISAIVRSQDQVSVLEKAGVNCILFGGLDDIDACRRAASQHDVVISAASAAHDASAEAWVRGLGERKKETGDPVYYIHTTGETVIGYLSVLGEAVTPKVWSDMDDFHAYELAYPETVESRPVKLPFLPVSEAEGVSSYVIVPTTVYGRGTGMFATMTSQIPPLAKESIKNGKTIVVGGGNGVWNHVHIEDLSKLYTALLDYLIATPLAPQKLPDRRIIWAENGTFTWISASKTLAEVLKSQGLVESEDVETTTLTDAAKLMGVSEKRAAGVWGSQTIGKGVLARKYLDWAPVHGDNSWDLHFNDVVEDVR